MPFLLNKEDENNAGSGGNISGVSTSFGTNTPGQTASQSNSPARSGQYQNIQKYLDANKSQATQMGQDVSQKVSGQVDQAQKAVGDLGASVQKVSAFDPSKTLSNISGATQQEKDVYKSTKNTGGYSGPQDVSGLTDYGAAYTKANQAKELVGKAGSEFGQQELLKQTYARPNYTKGANRLDQALLGASDAGKQQIQSLSDKYKGLEGQFKSGFESAGTNIANAQKQAALNKMSFNPAETSARQNIINPLEEKAKQANLSGSKFGEYSSDVSDLNLSPETLAALGLKSGQRTYGTNLSNYISGPASQATAGTIANQDERARYNDLMNFIGGNTGDIPMTGAQYQQGSVNTDKLKADIASKEAAFKEWAKAQNVSTSANAGGAAGGTTYEARTNANLLDYLNDPNSIKSTSGWTGGMSIGASDEQMTALDKQARENAFNQLQGLLSNSGFGYDQVINQGAPTQAKDVSYNVTRSSGQGIVGNTQAPGIGLAPVPTSSTPSIPFSTPTSAPMQSAGSVEQVSGVEQAPSIPFSPVKPGMTEIKYDPNIINNPLEYLGSRTGISLPSVDLSGGSNKKSPETAEQAALRQRYAPLVNNLRNMTRRR